jgi:serine/threonine protein kinase
MEKTILQHYQIDRQIGQGGMATVYMAHDNKFDTNVAIKVLNKEFVHNDNIRKRFLAEAKSMFRMSHPNIIKVNDLIEENDTVAFVMEYIEGETLKEYIDRKGKLNDDEIKTIFSQMLDAVGYVHEQNLVHRDIKPSNFMIDKKGKVKLMDFGIAKTLDASSSEYTQTGTGMQMGTPMYMSPEQITETKSVTAQSDIYSLGVVLWQMVTGQKPYDTKTLSSFQLQMSIVNTDLNETNSIWETAIKKSTNKIPEARFHSCRIFLQELPQEKGTKIISSGEETIIMDERDYSNNTEISSSNSKFSKHDFTGYFKWEDVDITSGQISIQITKGNENKDHDGFFEESYRLKIEIYEEANNHNNQTSNRAESGELFLVETNGSWELDNGYIIKKTKNIRISPESHDQKIAVILAKIKEMNKNQEAIFQVQNLSISKIVFKNLDDNQIQTIHRQDDMIKRLVHQQNAQYLNEIMDSKREKEELKKVVDALSSQEAFWGGSIDYLDEYINAVSTCFQKDYSCVNFNGDLWKANNNWPSIHNDELTPFNLPAEIRKNVIIIAKYKITQGLAFFAEKEIEVYFAAYDPRYSEPSAGYIYEKQPSGELVRTNQKSVSANLLFIRINKNIWRYSMSCWIDAFREIPCISGVQISGDVLKINSYKQFSINDTPGFQDEINLNAKINKYILNLWQNIDMRSII